MHIVITECYGTKTTDFSNLCTILAWADQSWNARSICRERAYGRLWSMADRTWQIEYRGEFRLALRRATSLPRGNKRDYVSYKTLVRWRFACALRGSARGFWFIDSLGLRPRGLCTVATRACHVNHAPPSYNYNINYRVDYSNLANPRRACAARVTVVVLCVCQCVSVSRPRIRYSRNYKAK